MASIHEIKNAKKSRDTAPLKYSLHYILALLYRHAHISQFQGRQAVNLPPSYPGPCQAPPQTEWGICKISDMSRQKSFPL